MVSMIAFIIMMRNHECSTHAHNLTKLYLNHQLYIERTYELNGKLNNFFTN